jgi:pimeloyl-ACP methyl ester carboxylesterase
VAKFAATYPQHLNSLILIAPVGLPAQRRAMLSSLKIRIVMGLLQWVSAHSACALVHARTTAF